MKKLETQFKIYGDTNVQIKRNGVVALYKRSATNYEVIIIKQAPEEIKFDKQYPAREVYPGTEEFGTKGWSFMTLAVADKKYNELLNNLEL